MNLPHLITLKSFISLKYQIHCCFTRILLSLIITLAKFFILMRFAFPKTSKIIFSVVLLFMFVNKAIRSQLNSKKS